MSDWINRSGDISDPGADGVKFDINDGPKWISLDKFESLNTFCYNYPNFEKLVISLLFITQRAIKEWF